MPEYIDREHYCNELCRCNKPDCDKTKCPLWAAPLVSMRRQWISVEDRLPEPNVLVLCVWLDGRDRKQNRGFGTYQHHGVWYVSNEGMPEVTHWMPLPEPPKDIRDV